MTEPITIEQAIQTPVSYVQYLKAHLEDGADLEAGTRAMDNSCPIHRWLATTHPEYSYISVSRMNITYRDTSNKFHYIPIDELWVNAYIHLIDSDYNDDDENGWKVTYQQAWDALCEIAPQSTQA